MISYSDFEKVDIRVGKIIGIENFPEAKKPAYRLTIDFGPDPNDASRRTRCIRQSSAQISHYSKEQLVGRLVLCVFNFAPKQIGPFISEVLTLGVPDEKGRWTLVQPDSDVPLGGRLA